MKKFSAISSTFGLYLISAIPAFAAPTIIPVDPCPSEGGGFRSLCTLGFNGGIVSKIITIAFIIASLIALAFLIYGGIRWIVSGGDKAGVETARNTIVAALVGLVIVFLAYFIIRIIFNFFGLNFGTFELPSLTAK